MNIVFTHFALRDLSRVSDELVLVAAQAFALYLPRDLELNCVDVMTI
jgi:hypothetical protein